MFYDDLQIGNTSPRAHFLQRQELTSQQILDRIGLRAETSEILPWRLGLSPVIYSIFSPTSVNLWLTIEEARVVFDEVHSQLKESGTAERLSEALAIHSKEQMSIRKAILLALGPFVGRYWSRADWPRMNDSSLWKEWKEDVLKRMMQLSLFLSAVESLSQSSSHKIEMYAQDPCFGAGEEQFLRELGFEILQLGEAERLTGPDTFVFAPRMVFGSIWNTMSRCAKHQPAIYVTTGYEYVMEEFNDRKEENQKWVLKWCESREEILHAKETQVSRLEAWKEERVIFDAVEIPSELQDNRYALLRNGFWSEQIQARKSVPTAAELAGPCNHACLDVMEYDDGREALEVGVEGPRPEQTNHQEEYFLAAAMLYPARESSPDTNCAVGNLSHIYFFLDGGSNARALAQAAGTKRKCEFRQAYRTK